MEEATLQEILEGTVAVARGLEALQSEHETVLTDFYATEDLDSTEASKNEATSHIKPYGLRHIYVARTTTQTTYWCALSLTPTCDTCRCYYACYTTHVVDYLLHVHTYLA